MTTVSAGLATLLLTSLSLLGACKSLNQAPELGSAAVVVQNPLNVPVSIFQVFRDASRVGDTQREPLGTVAARDSATFSITAGGRGWYDFVLVADSSDYRIAGVSRTYHVANGQTIRWIVSVPPGMTAAERCRYTPMALECRR